MFKSPSGIIETGDRFISSMLRRADVDHVVGSSMSGLIIRLSPCRLTIRPVTTRPSVGGDRHRLVLVADRLAGHDDRLEQVADAEPAGDAGEVGPEAAALVVVAVAGEALGGGEEQPGRGRSRDPSGPISTSRRQLVERPLLDERPLGHRRRPAAAAGLGLEDRLERGPSRHRSGWRSHRA